MTGPDPYALAGLAASVLAERTGVVGHDVAVVLGSGWLPVAGRLGRTVAELPAADLPGFVTPAVAGHPGVVRSVATPAGLRVLLLLGRIHLYEGLGVDAVVHGVRTAAAAGCRTVVLTNACGTIDPRWTPGTPVLIADHINLTGVTPLRGPRFVDLTDLYASRLRLLCQAADPALGEGVYVQFPGPQYETPAEVRMAAVLGGGLVGMSTALEAIAAREAGMEVLGIGLVTNLAAGLAGAPLDHAEVLASGARSAERIADLLAGVLAAL